MLAAALLVQYSPAPAAATGCPTAATAYAGGSGTAGDPYQVADATHLLRLAATPAHWGDHFLQTGDVTLTGCLDTMIGTAATPFSGRYDGGDFLITGLTIDVTHADVGLFRVIEQALLRRIHLRDVTVTGDARVGALVGESRPTSVIEYSSAVGSVTSTGNRAGGLVGLNGGFIEYSYADVTVTGGGDHTGGLAAENIDTIRFSFALGDVTGTDDYSGGLVGSNDGGAIRNAYARGAVTGGDYVGGLIGYHDGFLSNAFSTGVASVTGSGASDVGGLIGRTQSAWAVLASFWDTSTSGLATSAGGSGATGLPTADLLDITTFLTQPDTSDPWLIVAGWAVFDPAASRVWGICAAVNDGYPFLLWQHAADPCATTEVRTSSLTLTCTPGLMRVGSQVTCTVTGGARDVTILWRAAYNPDFAGEGVTLDANGSGTFVFTVPRAALGSRLTVELVAWTAPLDLGIVEGPAPASVPAGGGPLPSRTATVLGLLGLMALLTLHGPKAQPVGLFSFADVRRGRLR
jgi:hypothetical protein